MPSRASYLPLAAALAALSFGAVAADSPAPAKKPAEAKPAANKAAPPAAPQPKRRDSKVGTRAPDFEFTTLNGRKTKLSEFQGGKPLTLILFEAACGPCLREMQRAETEISQQGMAVLGVGRDAHAEELKKLRENMKAGFAMAEDPERKIYNLFSGEKDVPRAYVIDAQGKIAYESVGYVEEDFPKLVAAMKTASLKAAPAAPAKPSAEAKPAAPAKPAPATKPAEPAKKK